MGRPRSQSPSRSPSRGRKPEEGRRRENYQRNGGERNGNGGHTNEKENYSDTESTLVVADEKTWGLGRRAKKETGDHPLSSGDEIELVDEDTDEMKAMQELMGIGGFTSTKLLDEAEKVDLLGSISEKRTEERKKEREKPRTQGTLTGGNMAPLVAALQRKREVEGRPRLLPERRRVRSRSPRERRRSRSRSRSRTRRRSRSRSRSREKRRSRSRSRSPRGRRRSRSRSRDRRRRSRSRSHGRSRERDRRREDKRQRRSRSHSRSRKTSQERPALTKPGSPEVIDLN